MYIGLWFEVSISLGNTGLVYSLKTEKNVNHQHVMNVNNKIVYLAITYGFLETSLKKQAGSWPT